MPASIDVDNKGGLGHSLGAMKNKTNIKEDIKGILEDLQEQLENYKGISDRIANRSFVLTGSPGDVFCLTEIKKDHFNFSGSPHNAVTFTSKEAAKKAAEKISVPDSLQPTPMGLGTAYRKKHRILEKLVCRFEEALAKCES